MCALMPGGAYDRLQIPMGRHKVQHLVDGRGIRNQIHPFAAGLTRSGALPFGPPSVAVRRRRNSWRIVPDETVSSGAFAELRSVLKCFWNRAPCRRRDDMRSSRFSGSFPQFVAP